MRIQRSFSRTNLLPDEKNIVVLAFGASKNLVGRRIAESTEIFDALASRSCWYVPRASHRIALDGTILFYENAKGFVATAKIAGIHETNDQDESLLFELGLRNFTKRLQLQDVVRFPRHVPLPEVAPIIGFVSNKKNWGLSVRNCPKRMTPEDYAIVLSHAGLPASRSAV